MDQEIAQLRAQVKQRQARAAPTRTRYSPEFRQRVLEVIRARQAAGFSIRGVSREVGLKETTLQRWLKAESNRGRLRRVLVEPSPSDPSGPGGMVVFAGPLRIEGLNVAELAALVRSLA